ncbi:threonine ammonia-lyase [Stappia indica]|uniref:Pyridoxal-phosphate dependent enzyme n=1 Tax=Stappia indica TaxID=538381 RepID=A0A857C6G3_9HYPH|nr:threonine/serine dehydratase [Stappia indica]QGZ34142.1 pyridoxal-phosphate dependent enzyme [Stappia indica]
MDAIPVSSPVFQDIRDAQQRIAGEAVVTPLLRSAFLDELTGGTVLLKAENLQRTGSFKFRGAFNRLSMIPADARAGGVVACSSGNHAQGVAEAARVLGMPATIVMPQDAPQAKLDRTRRSGARVVTYRRGVDDRDVLALEIARETAATMVHPYNDAGVIAGQGTIGAEVAEQAAALGLVPEAMLTCAGGGGMTGGIALALETLLPDCELLPVEPEGFDDHGRSLTGGTVVANPSEAGSVCDALLARQPGEIGFSITRRRASRGLAVSDAEALAAVAFAFRELKLVVEPGGAVCLAAVLSGRLPVKGRVVALTLSGGNIDADMMAKALAG